MKSDILRKSLILAGLLVVSGCWLEGRSSDTDKSTGKSCVFRILSMGETVDEEGTKAGFRSDGSSSNHLGFTEFEAPDGEILTVEYGGFLCPEEAKRYLNWKVARSSKVLTQGVKKDAKGKQVGYRAVVLLATEKKQLAVMWTNGAVFREIIANSLTDALVLEKRYGH